jgi:hypothetical protein
MIRGFSVHVVLKHKKIGAPNICHDSSVFNWNFPVDIVKNALKKVKCSVPSQK